MHRKIIIKKIFNIFYLINFYLINIYLKYFYLIKIYFRLCLGIPHEYYGSAS